jgi:thiol-disulfide isomerase/thioredoxin
MKVKFFWQEDCPKCPAAKVVCQEMESEGINVEYLDIKSVEGMAEAAFYGVLATPTTIVVDREENELVSWRGEIPEKEKIWRLKDS